MSGLLSHRVLVVLLIGVLAAAGDACAQTTWYVDDDAASGGDGSAAHPFDTIQEGIDAAVDGDTVLVLDGTYTGAGNRNLDFRGRLITVRSANGAAGCVIDCQGAGRGLSFHSGETAAAMVQGFTITNGDSYYYGGGMFIGDSSPTVTQCTFSGNDADDGGGMFNYASSSPAVTNCILWGDTPDEIFNADPNSAPTVTYSDVQGGYGGTGNIHDDPLFVDADGADDTFGTDDDNLRLAGGSPCINAGDNAAVPPGLTTDLDGNPRISHGTVDMGAYERPTTTATGC